MYIPRRSLGVNRERLQIARPLRPHRGKTGEMTGNDLVMLCLAGIRVSIQVPERYNIVLASNPCYALFIQRNLYEYIYIIIPLTDDDVRIHE